MLYFLALVLGVSGAVALAWYFKLGKATTVATLLPTLAPLYLSWKAFEHDRAEALPTMDLKTAANQLTQAVENQWDDEAAIRRMNDPYPLPVGWRAADPDLVEPWEQVADLARGWPGGPPGDPTQWPANAAGLAGADGQIGEVFAQRVPTRRLVVLGEPGSGKTMLLVRLLQDLINRRPDGGPVPVLFSLASWDPAHQPLKDYLAQQLRRDHAGLRASAPPAAPGTAQADLAQALLDARLILPLLDGFDELPRALHAIALDALNRALPAKQPLVLASRRAAYRDATGPDAMVRLNGAAGIDLLPLTADEAAAYLRRDAGGEDTPVADRWNTVATHLGTDTPVGQALRTPLGLFLARTIYNPRPDISATPRAVPHPDELCSTPFLTQTDVATHLFNAYIPAAYTLHHPHPPRWTTPQAHRTLTFLARHLETNRDGNPELAWWELTHAMPPHTRRPTIGLVVGLVVGLVAGLVAGLVLGLRAGLVVGLRGGLVFGLIPGLVFGLGFGLMFGLVAGLWGSPSSTPSTRLSWSSPGGAGLGAGLGGVLAGVLVGGLEAGLGAGLGVGLVGGLMAGLGVGLGGTKPDLTTVTGPVALLTQDRRTFLVTGLGGGLVLGLVCVLVLILMFEPGPGLAAAPVLGLAGGLVFGLGETAWGGWVIAKTYLALRRQVPWRLMTFLQDAHEHRGVLRQVGAVYEFRHLDLQHHLSNPGNPPPDRHPRAE
ncbi:NACHT domain-containing protein [Streptomyces sp. 900105245]